MCTFRRGTCFGSFLAYNWNAFVRGAAWDTTTCRIATRQRCTIGVDLSTRSIPGYDPAQRTKDQRISNEIGASIEFLLAEEDISQNGKL